MDESQNDCAGQKKAEKKSHIVWLNLHKSLENANLSIMTENVGCLSTGGVGRQGLWMLEEILEVMGMFFISSVMTSQVHACDQMFSFIH